MATRIISKWFVLGTDLVVVGVCFFLAYLIRFNLSLNFDTSGMALQLGFVVLMALASFLLTGSFKGVFKRSGAEDVYKIFVAVTLLTVLTILVLVGNGTLEFFPGFSIPLSIIIVNSVLCFLGLTASHLILKALHHAIVGKSLG